MREQLVLRVSRMASDLPQLAAAGFGPVLAAPGGVPVLGARARLLCARMHLLCARVRLLRRRPQDPCLDRLR